MSKPSCATSRRQFLQTSGGITAAGLAAPYWLTSTAVAEDKKAPSDKINVGAIGVGGRGVAIAMQASYGGEMVAAADVDQLHLAKFQGIIEGRHRKRISGYGDYRRLLERKDIDAVTIGTPDHWHAKIAIEALQAGKDVYCEKPLSLTVEEGQLVAKAVRDTGKIFQVGTQQRSEMGRKFLQAVTMVREGRIGDVKRVLIGIDGAPARGPFPVKTPPCTLDWEMWLGQAPMVDYREERAHKDFRWWYEYSGGKMTDWGAHHVDIAHWALGLTETGPTTVNPVSFKHPVPFEKGQPTDPSTFNTANAFQVDCSFAEGPTIRIGNKIEDEAANFGNGIFFEGTKGRFFVNRGKITGKPVEELKDNPLPEDAMQKVYKGRKPKGHMADFFDCVKTREEPVSDVYSHHRSLTTCHLANIAIRLGRSLQWDPKTETLQGDPEASAMLSRTPRQGYELPTV